MLWEGRGWVWELKGQLLSPTHPLVLEDLRGEGLARMQGGRVPSWANQLGLARMLGFGQLEVLLGSVLLPQEPQACSIGWDQGKGKATEQEVWKMKNQCTSVVYLFSRLGLLKKGQVRKEVQTQIRFITVLLGEE